eukprot:TRINITY_DN10920_c2_g2_i1.p1 TRINITY_DN10920_c2_g2~~TRINITY_DN10920_c2_g2_i1.p1  ORF type:complete len:594 (+),score=114.22 TRINITY_DN10920_c2_g2_i1:70-1851(+)
MFPQQPAMEAECCAICLESLETPGRGCQRLTCGHTLHEHCIIEMRRHGLLGKCPVCRLELEDLLPVEELFLQACFANMRHSYEEAFQKCWEVVELDENHGGACEYLGRCFSLGLGVEQDNWKAVSWYEKAERLGRIDIRSNLGQIYKELGKESEAEELFSRAYDSVSGSATFNLALLHQERGDLKEAEKLYWRAHRLGNRIATYNLANMKSRSNDTEMAEQLYLEVIATPCWPLRQGSVLEDRKTRAEAQNNLGVLYAKQGKWKEAFELFSQSADQGKDVALRNIIVFMKERLQQLGCEDMYFEMISGFFNGEVKSVLEALKSGSIKPLANTLPKLSKGCRVVLYGLDSESGRKLNSKTGVVLGKTDSRIAVSVDGVSGMKLIRKANLMFAPMAQLQQSHSRTAEHVTGVNALLMDAIAHSNAVANSVRVVVIEYSRNEEWFRQALATADELQERRQAIEDAGFDIELPCGAKCFVAPHLFENTEKEMSKLCMDLNKRHVVIEADMENVILEVVERRKQSTTVRERGSFKLKGSTKVDVDVGGDGERSSSSSSSSSSPSSSTISLASYVKRTFIEVPISSSLRSLSSVTPRTF